MTRELNEFDLRLIEAKKRVEPFANEYAKWKHEIWTYVSALNADELRTLIAEGDLFGQTNCGWHEYTAAHVIAAEARVALRALEAEKVPA